MLKLTLTWHLFSKQNDSDIVKIQTANHNITVNLFKNINNY